MTVGSLAGMQGLSMLRLMNLLKDKRAATAVEYGMILALLCIAMLFALRGVANVTITMWNGVSEKVSSN